MPLDPSKNIGNAFEKIPTPNKTFPSTSRTWNGREVEHLQSISHCLVQKGIVAFSETQNRTSDRPIQKIVDDGWSVTSYNDEVWVEPGTLPGGRSITREQYENFLNGMRELQTAMGTFAKEALDLRLDSIKQKIEELQRTKDTINWESLKSTFNILAEAFVIFRGAHPLYAGPACIFAIHNLLDIAKDLIRSIDISREIDQLQKMEKATERDRLKEAREK
jgi:hypothetical protein